LARAQPHQQVVVSSKEQFDQTVQHYLTLGYGPRQMGADLAILVKAGAQKNLGCGFFFWLIVFFPIAIMMLVSRNRAAVEYTVTIRLEATQGSVLPRPPGPQPEMPRELRMSDDGESWWDGGGWVPVSQATPPMARRSEDGQLWWDGEGWRAVT